jgi:hypothetical protein
MADVPIFVFGSNEAGRHGKGAAKWAYQQRGAKWGLGFGESGNSFAIPTKDRNIKTLPLQHIAEYVRLFMEHASLHPDKIYEVTPIGCGLAGYSPSDIAPMFIGAPPNVHLPDEFAAAIRKGSD